MTGQQPVDGSGMMSAEPAPASFRGYSAIRYTPCPDEFFDQQLAEMDDDELRVTLYAFRRTFGFKKTDDAISISQFLHGITTRDGRQLDRGCGLKTPRQVLSGLAKAERRGVLLSAFCCRTCTGRVPDETLIEEARSQRLVNGQLRHYQVRVVPRLCPQCGARLRGFEEKRYRLNVLDESATGQTLPPSVKMTDPPAPPPPSVVLTDPSVTPTDPLYPGRQIPSVESTETRNSSQDPVKQQGGAGDRSGCVDLATTRRARREPVEPSARPAVTTVPIFIPPGSELPSPQLWAAAVAQATPLLERNDLDGWLRAATLLAVGSAAERPPTAGGNQSALTLVLGVPTEHARRRCTGRALRPLAAALSTLLGRSVTLEPVITARWLAEAASQR